MSDRILQSKDLSSLKTAIGSSATKLGFDKFALFSFQLGYEPNAVYSDNLQLDGYLKNRSFVDDPILSKAGQEILPFSWETTLWPRKLSKKQKTTLDNLRSIDVKRGISVPVRGPKQSTYVLCMSHIEGKSNFSKLFLKYKQDFHSIGVEASAAFDNIRNEDVAHQVKKLSQREIECLYWTSRGKTSNEVATILEISERTVNFHLNNAMSKLDTHSKHMAVLKAISLGKLPL